MTSGDRTRVPAPRRALLAGALGAVAAVWALLPGGAAVEAPSFGAPAIVTPGAEVPVVVRVAVPWAAPAAAATLASGDARVPLALTGASARGPRQRARFRVPADCPPGNYDLLVRAGGGWARARRAVAVLREIPERFTVAQITDLHFGATAEGEAAVLRIIDELNRLAPAVVVVTGDVAQDGKAQEYERAQRALARLAMPIVCVPGNHDRRGWAAYLSAFGDPIGTVRFGSWTFLRLDSAHGRDQFTESQLRFIGAALAAGDPHRTIVLVHVPLTGRRAVKAHADAVAEMFGRTGVPLVLSGHWHYRADSIRDSGGAGEPGAGPTRYVVTATAGGPPVAGPSGVTDPRGFTLVSVENGRVTAVEARPAGGVAATGGTGR